MADKHVISIIWNLNNLCPYTCDICLVNAKHVQLWANKSNTPHHWVDVWLEISLEDKIKIIQHLNYSNVEIDVCWWEPLLFSESLDVLKTLSDKFWRKKITITSTWVSNISFDAEKISLLETYVGSVDFTYDWVDSVSYRPSHYNQDNLVFVDKFSRSVKKTAQIVLTSQNISQDNIQKTIFELKQHNIDAIFLLKFHPIWRGIRHKDLVLSTEVVKNVIDSYILFSEKCNGPKIIYQKTLLGQKIGTTKGCAFFINERWDLFSNAWMKDKFGKDNCDYKIWNLITDSFIALCWKNYKEIKTLQDTYNGV